jgi:flagellin
MGTIGVTDTLANLATTITNGGYGLTATLNGSAIGTPGQPGYHAIGTVLTFTEDVQYLGNGNAASVTNAQPLGDAVVASLVPGTSLGKLTVGNTADTLTGTLKGVKGDGTAAAYQIDLIGQTLPQLAAMINTDPSYGITATLNQAGDALTFTTTPGALGTPTLFNVGNITTTLPAIPTSIALTEVPTPGAANSTQLGSLAITSADTLSGSLVIGAHTISIGLSNNSGATLADAINNGGYGVQATYDSIAGTMTFTSANSAMHVDATLLQQTPAGGAPGGVTFTPTSITSSDYYSIGISGIIADSSTGGGTANVGITTDSNGLGGVATTSYSDAPGVNLSTTDLTTQVQAQSALNSINLAITAAAALDGYIGGQINMLNSVSQVLTTQQENVISAQNAIQATDYASAAANLSKYQILSQTGIAALAQANSIQQEVTKLLQ